MVTNTQSCSWREWQPARTCGPLKRDTDVCHVGPSKEGVKKINPSVFFSNLWSNSTPFGPIQPEASEQKHQLSHCIKVSLLGAQSREEKLEADLEGYTGIIQHTKLGGGHSKKIIHEDWRDLEEAGLGISFPDWDFSYCAGEKAMTKVV